MTNKDEWIKSSFCNGGGNCVELRPTKDGGVAMRDSKNPAGGELNFTGPELLDFMRGVRNGDFDSLLSE